MTNLIHITAGAQELAPGDPLRTDPSCDQLVHVTEGVLYVRLDEHDVVLFAGDSLTVSAGEPRRAWNAGDEAASVLVHDAGTGCPEGLRVAKAA